MTSRPHEGSSPAPNPGSQEAIAAGCTCPRMDNGWGKGAFGGGVVGEDGMLLFWYATDCPLHAVRLPGGAA